MENFRYGYRHQLVPFEPEQSIITRIGDMYFNEGLSQYEICRQLNKEGVKHRGRQWQQPTLCRILKREFEGRTRLRRVGGSRSVPTPQIGWREEARRREAETSE